MQSILEVKKEIEKLTEQIDVLDNRLDELEYEMCEVEESISTNKMRKHRLIGVLNTMISQLGKESTGNAFIDALRKTFPYVGSNGFKSPIFNTYYIGSESILGTNGYVVFEVAVDQIPDEMKGKYLYYEAGIEADKIDQYIIDFETIESSGLTAEKIKKKMSETISAMKKALHGKVLDSIITNGTRDEDFDMDIVKLKLETDTLFFDKKVLDPLQNIFNGPVTIKWSKKLAPVLFKDEKSSVVICPLKRPY